MVAHRLTQPYCTDPIAASHTYNPNPDPNQAPGITLAAHNDSLSFDVTIGNVSLRVNTSRRMPWKPSAPDGPGPEGWAEYLGKLLPCHYYVQSFGSEADYEIDGGLGGPPVGGHGLAHLETNWGTTFPEAWVWAQAVGERADLGKAALLVTRMELRLGPLVTTQSVVALRAGNLSWSFRDVDLDRVNMSADGCAGTLLLDAASPHLIAGRPPAQQLRIAFRAPPLSFSAPLYIPTPDGFSNQPGSVESYAALAEVQAYAHGALVLQLEVQLAALEFGGRWRCGNATQSSFAGLRAEM